MQRDMRRNALQATSISASRISGKEILKLMAILWRPQGCSKAFKRSSTVFASMARQRERLFASEGCVTEGKEEQYKSHSHQTLQSKI